MKCVICKEGDTAPGTVTVTLQRGDTAVVIRDVPAAVCRNCGEYYLDEAVASKLYRQGETRCSDTPKWKFFAMRRERPQTDRRGRAAKVVGSHQHNVACGVCRIVGLDSGSPLRGAPE